MNLFSKIGFSTNIFDNPADISELVGILSKDFRIVEVEFEKDLRLLIDSDEGAWDVQREKLNVIRESTGVYYSAHAPYIGMSTDISNGDEVTRLSAVDYLSRYIIKASEIGAKIITIHPGYVEFDRCGMVSFDFDQLAKSLDVLSVVAAGHGVDILLENTGPDREKYIVLSDEQHYALCRHLNVYLTLDLVHFHAFYHTLSDTEYFDKLKKILPLVKNAHFNDVYNGEHVHLPLGKGDFDYHRVIEFMGSEGYQGNFIVEESGGGYSPDDFVASSRSYVNTLKSGSIKY